MPSEHDLLVLLQRIRRLPANLSLGRLAAHAGWSRFHLHRTFTALVRETPKRYVQRLRLERAAAMLVSSDRAVRDVAIAAGFNSHEVFTCAFSRQFGVAPARYRARALAGASAATRARHAAQVDASGPCITLHHLTVGPSARRVPMPTLSIDRQVLAAQPVVFVRLRPAGHELQSAIAEGLGKTFPYAIRAGLTIAGRPFTRYIATGPGLYTIDVGVPVAAANADSGEGDIQIGALAGGPAAVAVHGGPYEQLGETYSAIERWTESNGFRVGGPPWEFYVTDPADLPDPGDWRTQVCWPLAE